MVTPAAAKNAAVNSPTRMPGGASRLRRSWDCAASRTARAIAAMPLPRLVDSASSRPRSFRNTGSVATISAGARPGIDPQQQCHQAGHDRRIRRTGEAQHRALHAPPPSTPCSGSPARGGHRWPIRPGNGGRARPSSMMKRIPLHPVVEHGQFLPDRGDGLGGGGFGRLDERVGHGADVTTVQARVNLRPVGKERSLSSYGYESERRFWHGRPSGRVQPRDRGRPVCPVTTRCCTGAAAVADVEARIVEAQFRLAGWQHAAVPERRRAVQGDADVAAGRAGPEGAGPDGAGRRVHAGLPDLRPIHAARTRLRSAGTTWTRS